MAFVMEFAKPEVIDEVVKKLNSVRASMTPEEQSVFDQIINGPSESEVSMHAFTAGWDIQVGPGGVEAASKGAASKG